MTEEKKERFELLLEEIRDKVITVAEGHEVIRSEMGQMKGELIEKIEENNAAIKWVAGELGRKIEAVHASLKKEIDVTSRALDYEIKQVGKTVEEVKTKLDEHVRMPAHA